MSNTSVLEHDTAPGEEERIVQWLREYIGKVLEVPIDRIDADASFQHLGLDSSAAVGMTGDLGDWLGREIDAAAAYDYPTIQALARALSAS
ncbi:MAG: acyl carrier protein [Aquisalimonadaceae bacterium]